jgi:SAM-dependent methyltransferase
VVDYEAVSEDDPVTGRRFLTESAYADDRHIRTRMGIWSYAEAPVNAAWRISPFPWDGTQVVADVGCGNGFDLRQIVPQGRCRHAFGVDLSAGMLRTLDELLPTGRLTLLQADAQRLPLGDGQVDVALCMHMLYHVPDVPAAVAELRRIVRPGGTVLASTNGADSLSEMYDLLDAAISGQLGRPASAKPADSFTTETGGAFLEGRFSEVTLHRYDVPLALPDARAVTAYLDSVREPILSQVGQFDFDEALGDVAARVDRVVGTDGCFRTVIRSGVFVCR